jgi:hypothetical protein
MPALPQLAVVKKTCLLYDSCRSLPGGRIKHEANSRIITGYFPWRESLLRMIVPFFSTQIHAGNIRIDFCKGYGYTDYESAFIETLSKPPRSKQFSISQEVLPSIYNSP